MMNPDGLIDTVLSKAGAAADAAEVFYESSESRPVEFENNKLKYVSTKSERGVGLRVIKDGRIGFSSTSDFARLDELVENALESAKFGQQAKFELPASCEPAEVETYDENVAAFTTRQMTELGSEMIHQVLARYPEVQCSADVSASVGDERIANTNGLDLGHRSTTFTISVTALEVNDDGLLWVGDGRTSSLLLQDTTKITNKVTADLDLARKEAVVSTGVYPAIFTPDAMATLFISLSEGVNGKLVQKGASPLAGKLGEQILDQRLSVFDDALIDYAASSAPHDTEGLRSARTALIEKGVLKNYLFDLQTAGTMDAEPTGNGLRHYEAQPTPGDNNTIIRPGETPFEEMLSGTRRGLLVSSMLGGATGNTLAGDFSVNLELGFLIENGALAGRVKNCMVFGNIYDLLRDGIIAIGDTPEMKGSLSMPHFWFKGISAGAQ